MFISEIHVKNFRSFKNLRVSFNDGLNIIIGSNNSGKSNILKALAQIFDSNKNNKLTIDDFCKFAELDDLKTKSPKIEIAIKISQSENEEMPSDDLALIGTWLTKIKQPYQALITYEFFLPDEKLEQEYLSRVKDLDNIASIFDTISTDYLRYYVYKIWIGNVKNHEKVDSEVLSKFDFQFLDAIRDVERDMFSGRNTLLKSIMDFFIDYDIKSKGEIEDEKIISFISERKKYFGSKSEDITNMILKRLKQGELKILSFAEQIGATYDGSKPAFSGNFTENDLFSILQLIVKKETGIDLPLSNNGLGYNNLIFMALLLSKMNVDSNGKYLGSNAKVFPMLVIEEPEAHLHPTMQQNFIDFVKNKIETRNVRQVFITSHSSIITSSSNIDNLICFYRNMNSEYCVAYPSKAIDEQPFQIDNYKKDSKKYVQRFFDATKVNMLFAERIILVEGLAEQLLLPIFAKKIGKSFEQSHVVVINIGGRFFEHFLKMFNSSNCNAINRKVACITDRDPVQKINDQANARYKSCYPFEYELENDKYSYQYNKIKFLNKTINSLDEMEYSIEGIDNIRFFSQSKKAGKTLEYQIAFDNNTNYLLLREGTANLSVLKKMVDCPTATTILDRYNFVSNSNENKRIINALTTSDINNEVKVKHLFASMYLNSVSKGINALELSMALDDDYKNLVGKENPNIDENEESWECIKYEQQAEQVKKFIVPQYLENAINWICE